MEKMVWWEQVRILGITNKEPSGLHLCWSASGIAFVTAASVVTVEMAAQSIAPQEDAFIGVFINDEKQFRQKIRAVPGKRKYIIYQQESAETIRIRLVKLTEEQYGNVWITNLITDAPVTRDAIPSRHLLFIGDSLTAGYGVDGINGISAFRTADEDVTKTYAYQAAEMLHADSRIVAYSGNDASYVRQIPSRERAFVEKYTDFIQQLKKVFADAKILLLYGLMEQTLCEKVQETAQRCGTEFLKLPLQNPVNGMGTDGHPGARTQQEIALYVERYMEQMMMWRTDER